MHHVVKNILGITLAAFAVIGSIAALRYAGAFNRQVVGATFSISGEGRVTVVPDIARFTFGVVTNGGTDVAAVQKENTTSVNRVIEFLKERGVVSEDIRTTTYAIAPRYAHGARTVIGYTVTNLVSVTVRDFAVLGGITAGVVERGVNSVSDLTFALDDPEAAQTKARAEAIIKAKGKARALAEEAGFTIGRIVSLFESGGVSPLYRGVEAFPAPQLEPGSEDVSVVVTIVYEIRE